MHDKTFTIIATKWGYMGSVWTPLGLWELGWFGNDRAAALAGINSVGAVESEADERAIELKRELNIYLQGFPVDFAVPIDWRGYTPFQRQVLQYTA
ncbi:MAG: cysteine methyltransferase, partial [Negativicutes bacterium]|nr:cysteine methyltransferase [Negativicutes bacterium]